MRGAAALWRVGRSPGPGLGLEMGPGPGLGQGPGMAAGTGQVRRGLEMGPGPGLGMAAGTGQVGRGPGLRDYTSRSSDTGVLECRAAVCWGEAGKLEVERVKVAPPGPGQCRIHLVSASVCHTDIWVNQAVIQSYGVLVTMCLRAMLNTICTLCRAGVERGGPGDDGALARHTGARGRGAGGECGGGGDGAQPGGQRGAVRGSTLWPLQGLHSGRPGHSICLTQ